jgi:hypothetical protein
MPTDRAPDRREDGQRGDAKGAKPDQPEDAAASYRAAILRPLSLLAGIIAVVHHCRACAEIDPLQTLHS